MSALDRDENETMQSKSYLSGDEALLHWMAECPDALAGLAKTHRDRLRLSLGLWQEAGCPDLKEWLEKVTSGAQREPDLDRVSPALEASSSTPSATSLSPMEDDHHHLDQ